LENLVEYAIDFFENLIKKYGNGRERRTELLEFQEVKATVVAANNQKLYIDRVNGFIGYGIKKEEYLMECSDIDNIISFKRNGTYSVSKISDKDFVGKDIIHCSVFRKDDERRIYNAIYLDGKSGKTYAKRFNVTSITREKEYNVTKGSPKSKVLYFSDNENGEAEVVAVNLTASCSAKNKQFEFDFSDLLIKGRGSMGNMVTKYPVRKVILKSAGVSTLGGVDIWYTPNLGRLNRDKHGDFVGNFGAEDKVMVIYKSGEYELTNFELTNHYDARQVIMINKFKEKGIITAIYYDGESRIYYIKRFQIETSTMDKKFAFLTEHNRTELLGISYDDLPRAEIKIKKDRKTNIEKKEFKLDKLVAVKGWKAMGNKLPFMKISDVKMLEPEIVEKEEKPDEDSSNDNNDSTEDQNDSPGAILKTEGNSEGTNSDNENKEAEKGIKSTNQVPPKKGVSNEKSILPKKPKDDDQESKSQLGLF
jgi:topoisomerase-4 subunit A